MAIEKADAPGLAGSDEVPVIRNYIGGRFVAGGERFAKINPVNGERIAEVAGADREMVDAAVAAAGQALKGEWGKNSADQRCDLLQRVAAGIEARFEEFVAAEVADTGKPAAEARRLDIPRGVANFRFFAELARHRADECFQSDIGDGGGALNYTLRKPLGVVAVICPWNLPLLLLTWKVAPALAAGNTVVVKPSEETPSTASLLAEVFDQAGVPPGVFNLVYGGGPGAAGEFLSCHHGVGALTFTGESATGAAIMKAAAPSLKPLSFELGGKNAAIVFADADFEAAVDGTVRSVFSNCGQVCLASERIYVQRPLFAPFVTALKERAEALRIGWPTAPETEMGPLISAAHRDKVLAYYRLAREEGATVVTGGGVPRFEDARDQGFYVEPTILTGLAESARCVKEEIFGPVCHVAPFDTAADAVRLTNDSDYGLAAAVWTLNLGCAHQVARALEVGIVWVNSWYLRDLRTPFGGMKLSGIGREGGMHSLDFYSQPTTICIKL